MEVDPVITRVGPGGCLLDVACRPFTREPPAAFQNIIVPSLPEIPGYARPASPDRQP
jgi:hypothetical protein